MKRTLHFWIAAMLSVAAIVTMTACSGNDKSTPETSSTVMPAETLIAEDYAETEAMIQSIDPTTRNVALRLADGQTETIQAPADVDLGKLKPGDVVVLGAYQRLSVKALPAGSAVLGTTRQVGAARSSPGETPGRAVGQMTRTVTEITAIDTVNNTVTLKDAGGQSSTLDVRNPDNQRKLKTLKVGDLVQIDFTEAVIASLKPKP